MRYILGTLFLIRGEYHIMQNDLSKNQSESIFDVEIIKGFSKDLSLEVLIEIDLHLSSHRLVKIMKQFIHRIDIRLLQFFLIVRMRAEISLDNCAIPLFRQCHRNR